MMNLLLHPRAGGNDGLFNVFSQNLLQHMAQPALPIRQFQPESLAQAAGIQAGIGRAGCRI